MRGPVTQAEGSEKLVGTIQPGGSLPVAGDLRIYSGRVWMQSESCR